MPDRLWPHFCCSVLGAAAALVPAAAARAADDAQSVASSRMSYSRFLEYLDMGRVKKVGSGGLGRKQSLGRVKWLCVTLTYDLLLAAVRQCGGSPRFVCCCSSSNFVSCACPQSMGMPISQRVDGGTLFHGSMDNTQSKWSVLVFKADLSTAPATHVLNSAWYFCTVDKCFHRS